MKWYIKNEEGLYHATCGTTKFQSRAFKWDTKEEAETELVWCIQHNEDGKFPTGMRVVQE